MRSMPETVRSMKWLWRFQRTRLAPNHAKQANLQHVCDDKRDQREYPVYVREPWVIEAHRQVGCLHEDRDLDNG
jgi:hypothetical protein